MKNLNIENLSEQELKDLMYNICKSGRVVIPQFYYKNHIETITKSDISDDDMIEIQSVFESDDTTHTLLEEAVVEIFDNIQN